MPFQTMALDLLHWCIALDESSNPVLSGTNPFLILHKIIYYWAHLLETYIFNFSSLVIQLHVITLDYLLSLILCVINNTFQS